MTTSLSILTATMTVPMLNNLEQIYYDAPESLMLSGVFHI